MLKNQQKILFFDFRNQFLIFFYQNKPILKWKWMMTVVDRIIPTSSSISIFIRTSGFYIPSSSRSGWWKIWNNLTSDMIEIDCRPNGWFWFHQRVTVHSILKYFYTQNPKFCISLNKTMKVCGDIVEAGSHGLENDLFLNQVSWPIHQQKQDQVDCL